MIEQFHKSCNALGIFFTYGTRQSMNLIFDKVDSNTYAVGLDAGLNRKPIILGEYGQRVGVNYTGTFIMVTDGDQTNTIYNETDFNHKDGEYYKTVKPMEEMLDKLMGSLSVCDGWQVNSYSSKDAYHLFDRNVNVLLVNFDITING